MREVSGDVCVAETEELRVSVWQIKRTRERLREGLSEKGEKGTRLNR